LRREGEGKGRGRGKRRKVRGKDLPDQCQTASHAPVALADKRELAG